LHALLCRGGAERCKVNIGGYVLLARGFVRVGTHGVVADFLHGPAMAPRELFVASKAVVDHDHKSVGNAGCSFYIGLRLKRHFDTFLRFRMNRVAVEEFEFLRGWRLPRLHKTTAPCTDAERSLCTDNLNLQRIKEFVGEYD